MALFPIMRSAEDFLRVVKNFSDLGEKEAESAKRRASPLKELHHNARLLSSSKGIARCKRMTVAQLALAWILHQGEIFVPIPGTYQISHLEEQYRRSGYSSNTGRVGGQIDRMFPRKVRWLARGMIMIGRRN